MAALALDDEQRPVRDLDVGQAQPEHLAAAQPAEQHRQHHRPVPVRAQRRRAARRPRPATGSSATCAAPAPTAPCRDRGRPARRVDSPRGTGFDSHAGVTASDQVRIEPRHRRQPPGDRARRQARLAIRHPNHRPVAALMRQELEHVRRGHLDRVLVDDREERLQIERHRPQRVRPSPARHELQIASRPADHRARNGPHPPATTDRTRHGKKLIPDMLPAAERTTPE